MFWNRICDIIKKSMFKNKKLLIIILCSVLVLSFVGFHFVQGAERPLEVPLPEIGLESGITTTPLLPDYVKYIFNFAMLICGFVAFGALVIGGVRYTASAGNSSTISDANNQMLSGVMGLVIILGSWLILTTINPELKIISVEYKEAEIVSEGIADISLCTNVLTEEGEEDCRPFHQSASTLGDFNGRVAYVKINNTEDMQYGAVLHSKTNWQGSCVVCLESNCDISKANGGYSITVFVTGDGGGGSGVTLYEADSYNELCGTECKNACSGFGSVCGEDCVGWQWWIFSDMRGGKCWPFSSSAASTNITDNVRSFYINGRYLVARFDQENFNGNCEVHRYSSMNIGAQTIKSLKVIPLK